ncbi:MAG: acyl carrier protein [Victivallales bacterium]|nr:acyl carrier protein [Victivallales bacterium]
MTEALSDKIAKIMVESLFLELQPEDINPETPLADYGVDSFLLLELLSALEQEFSLSLNPADISADNLRTLAALTALVQSKL